LEWASTIFPIENRVEPSEFIERIWRTRGVPDKAMISVAVPHWQIVVVRHAHRPISVFVRGPETKATIVDIPPAGEFIGIEFKLGAFIPALPVGTLVDVATELDAVSATRVHLAGSHWEIPTFENAADFVAKLARHGVLVRDSIAEQILLRKPVAITERSVQRRFLRATGLTYATVRQVERAERAAGLLTTGTPILDAVETAGYSDQAHMTRALKRFLGKTPGRLVPAGR
jgi:AraC-like DNA-binding protein